MHLDERIHDDRVELAAGAALQLGQRVVERERAPVGPRAGHRLQRVAGGDDPRAERDLVAGEAVGVALAVPALVAGAHERRDGLQRRRRADDALPDDGVLLDDRPLVVVQRAGLVQDGRGHRDLADVVQLAGAAQVLQRVRVQPEALADLGREAADVLHVLLEVGVVLAERAQQHAGGLVLGRAATARLVVVHAPVGAAERRGGVARLGGQQHGARGRRHDEAAAHLA